MSSQGLFLQGVLHFINSVNMKATSFYPCRISSCKGKRRKNIIDRLRGLFLNHITYTSMWVLLVLSAAVYCCYYTTTAQKQTYYTEHKVKPIYRHNIKMSVEIAINKRFFPNHHSLLQRTQCSPNTMILLEK